MTFIAWLARHLDRNTPVGDLSRDVLLDIKGGWAQGDGSADALKSRLDYHRASEGAWEAFRTARRSYNSYMRKHSVR